MLHAWYASRRPARAACAVALVLAAAAAAAAAPDKEDRKKDDNPPKADPALDDWIQTLVDRIVDRNDAIRESAREALVAVGKPALPALKKLAAGDDRTAVAARIVIARIETDDRPPLFGPGRPRLDPDMIFNFLAPGRDTLDVATLLDNPLAARNPVAKDRITAFLRRNNITNGQLTRDQFAQLFQEQMEARVGLPDLASALQGLDLTDQQKAKVKEVRAAHLKASIALLQKAEPGQPPDREAVGALRKDLLKAMKDVLDESQYKKFEKVLGGASAP
jgi:hypothetical protein